MLPIRSTFGFFSDPALLTNPLWNPFLSFTKPILLDSIIPPSIRKNDDCKKKTICGYSFAGNSGEKSNLTLRPAETEDFEENIDICPGLMKLQLSLNNSLYSTIICVAENGFEKGQHINLPLRWLKFCNVDVNGNFDGEKIISRIKIGQELILSKNNVSTPKESTIASPVVKEKNSVNFTIEKLSQSDDERRSATPTDAVIDISDLSPEGNGFGCPRCGKVFSYEYYRDKHLKYTRCVDQGDRKFPCPNCPRSFEKRDRLRIHMLHVHENHRPHACIICGKAFSQSSSLNKHLRVHSGERPYKCAFCPKAFTASSILRTHVRQHSGEKPFKCAQCGKAFASHAAHDSHVRRTHVEAKHDHLNQMPSKVNFLK